MLSIIPDVVQGQDLRTLGPAASAAEAAALMGQHDISAVLVVDEAGTLLGIVTERDLSRRVVARSLVGADVMLADIMSRDLLVLAPAESPFDALERMRERRVRHMPVVSDGKPVGMVSMRDLRHAIAHWTGHGRGDQPGGPRPGPLRRVLDALRGS